MLTANRIIGIVLIIFAGAVWSMAQGFPDQSVQGPGTAFFPQVMSILLIFLSICLIFINPLEAAEEKLTKEKRITFLLTIAVIVSYILITPQLGYVITTLGAVFLMVGLLGDMKWWKRLITAFVITGIVFAAFEWLFNVPLPQGLLI